GSGRDLPPLEILADEIQTSPEGKLEPPPRRAPSAEQTHRASELPGGQPARGNPTFGILVEDDPCAPQARPNDNFDLVVDSVPGWALPPVAKPPPFPAAPPPLPQVAALPQIPGFAVDDPNLATYRLEAWMPEKVAVMKVQGFVDSSTGEVVTSVPG